MFEPLFTTYTVAELTRVVKDVVEGSELLRDLRVSGEVSNFKRASSGHWYFTLKDRDAQLKCVMWRSQAERQPVIPQDGDAVEVSGYIGVYEASGVYQLYASRVRPVGAGNLYAQFEALKGKLDAEGLFDPERKRPLPAFPTRIGVVTSADAAAFQDVQNVLRRRFPLAEVILSPTLVQGAEAPAQIIAALERLQTADVAVILLVRGGGGIEDLWAFNDEKVARAVAASRIPIVTGVGHEIDFTIVDFVSDLRAPTPSAAAELVTPDVDDLRANLEAADDLLLRQIADRLRQGYENIAQSERTMRHLSPVNRIAHWRQRLDDQSTSLTRSQAGQLTRLRERLTARAAGLEAANPRGLLARGYAIVTRSEDGTRLSQATGTAPGVGLTLHFNDGELKVRVEDKDAHERYPRTLF